MFGIFNSNRKKETRISLIIPAYNEANTIANIITVAKKVKEINEIVVVNDGSTDNTEEVARSKGAIVFSHRRNKGKGAAIKTGIKKSKGEILIFLDGDMQTPRPFRIRSLIKPILRGKADFVKAYGYFTTKQSLYDAHAINVTKLVVRPLLKIFFPSLKVQDPLCGAFAGKRDFSESISIPKGYSADISILLDAFNRNLRIKETFLGYITHNMGKNPEKENERMIKMAEEVSETIYRKSIFRN